MTGPFEWLTTGATRESGEPRGWKLHAILGATEAMKGADVARLPSACGLDPRPWGMDLFIEKKCARCLRALGLACPSCRGSGYVRGQGPCLPCGGKGERR